MGFWDFASGGLANSAQTNTAGRIRRVHACVGFEGIGLKSSDSGILSRNIFGNRPRGGLALRIFRRRRAVRHFASPECRGLCLAGHWRRGMCGCVWVCGCVGVWIYVRMFGWMDVRMLGCSDVRMDGWMDGWMDMSMCICVYTCTMASECECMGPCVWIRSCACCASIIVCSMGRC